MVSANKIRLSKTSTSARKHQQGIRWRHWWKSFAKLGMWQARKEAGASHVFRKPNTVGTIRVSAAPISNVKVCVTVSLRKWGYRLRQHGAYFEPIYAHIRTRSMSSSLRQLCAEKSGQGLRRNSVITCSRTLTLWNTFGFKSVWLLPLALSEGQSVQQCSPNSARTEG